PADAPKAGATFANVISNFSRVGEAIDLHKLAFVAGATATLSGKTLELTEGSKTYAFTLAGTKAVGYEAESDGAGGTLIRIATTALAHAAAAVTAAPATGQIIATGSAGSASTLLGLGRK
ncbi:MAG TPA: hypothetical protein VFE13_21305, partial [Caulobacteraceae bacterium]|nr:hypothetical protein [Caulobacteraceae bacterium]